MALNTLGYVGLGDLFTTVFALKTKPVTFYSLGFIVAGFLTFVSYVTHFTASYIFSPPAGIAILALASILDFFIGVGHSELVKKEEFESWRIPRTFVRFGIQTVLVGFFFNMNILWPYLIPEFIVIGLLVVFILTTIWSIIENSHALGIITTEQFNLIKSFINIKNIIHWFKSKNNETNQ